MKTTMTKTAMTTDQPHQELNVALDRAEELLSVHDKSYAAITVTHVKISALLRQRLDAAIDATRQAAVNKELAETRASRARAIADVLAEQPAVQAARERVLAGRKAYGSERILTWRRRQREAVAVIDRLRAEGEWLTRSLEFTRQDLAEIQDPDAAASAVMSGHHPEPPDDPLITRIGAVLSRLAAAVGLAAAIGLDRKFDEDLRTREALGAVTSVISSETYQAVRQFECWDGLSFAVGELLDVSLLSAGSLRRAVISRCCRRVTTAAPGAAA
jgi:hypothetical protein